MRFPHATRPFLKVKGRLVYLYRAIDRDGNLVDVLLSEKRDKAAAEAFFRSARTVTSCVPERVTNDGHDAYPGAIKAVLGEAVRHRTNRYLNNHLEQDHRGIKQRIRPMGSFKSVGRPHAFAACMMKSGTSCAHNLDETSGVACPTAAALHGPHACPPDCAGGGIKETLKERELTTSQSVGRVLTKPIFGLIYRTCKPLVLLTSQADRKIRNFRCARLSLV